MGLTGDLNRLANLARTLQSIGADTLRESMFDCAMQARSIAGSLGAAWPRARRWNIGELNGDGFALAAESEPSKGLSRLNRLTTSAPPKPVEQVPPPMLEAFDAIVHQTAEKKLTNI